MENILLKSGADFLTLLLPNPARLVQPAAAPCHRVAQVVGGISSPALFPQCPSPLRPGTAGSAAAGLAPCPLPAPSLARRWLTHLPSRSTLSARQPQLFPHFMVCFFFCGHDPELAAARAHRARVALRLPPLSAPTQHPADNAVLCHGWCWWDVTTRTPLSLCPTSPLPLLCAGSPRFAPTQ